MTSFKLLKKALEKAPNVSLRNRGQWNACKCELLRIIGQEEKIKTEVTK